jgi:CheY-like chemotaxis protein
MTVRILVAHDKSERAEAMERLLEPHHEVTVCGDILQAMDIIKAAEQEHLDQTAFDLIICSVHINGSPSMSAFDLLKWTRGNLQAASVPFVLLDSEQTKLLGYVIDSIRSASNTLGASSYVELKDFETENFFKRMEEHLPAHLRRACEPV